MTTAQRRGTLAVCVLVGTAVVGAIVGAFLHAPGGLPPEDSALPVEWPARALLVLAVAWVAIGMLAARTRLVGRPGAAAARATWLSASRPWRARESTLGLLPLDRWLILLVPAALLVATRMLQTTPDSWPHLVLVLGAWVIFAAVLRLGVGTRSPWPVIASVGGVVVLRCILALIGLSVSGNAFAHEIWAHPVLRALAVGLGFALLVWCPVAAAWALQIQGGMRYGLGAVLAAAGAAVALPALAVALAGGPDALGEWTGGLGPVLRGVIAALGGQPVLLDALTWALVVAGTAAAVAGALVRPRPVR